MVSYTAEELAEKARLELGADLSPRTIYFYRQIGVLSPLAAAGSQPRFSERHFLELAAALALQRAPDRPTLAEIALMLGGLSEEELAGLARSVGPTARELMSVRPVIRLPSRGGHYYVAENMLYDPPSPSRSPAPDAPASDTSPAGSLTAQASRAVTINLAPGVTLHLGPNAPKELVSKLLALALDHAEGAKPSGDTPPTGAKPSGQTPPEGKPGGTGA
jgi:DNA-binding transcriptional MerR regulator